MPNLPQKLRGLVETRKQNGTYRSLSWNSDLVDFTSNDYLGLATRSPGEHQSEGVETSGSGGSRLLSGNNPWYDRAESCIAQFHRAETALIYNSGYDANLGLFSALLGRNDIVFYDTSIHASIRDGIALGKARSYRFAHNDLADLQSLATRVLERTFTADTVVYVVTESVFSMEGDTPNLKALIDYCDAMGFLLIVDEAHAVGVLGPGGRGESVACKIESRVFARVVTFGKALGCHGAAILCRSDLRDFLINFSRSLIYTTALPPQALKAIFEAYQWLESPQGLKAHNDLSARIAGFKKLAGKYGLQLGFRPANAAIQCYFPGNLERVSTFARQLQQSGFDVRPIRYPTVAKGSECLRFSLHSFNTEEEMDKALEVLSILENPKE